MYRYKTKGTCSSEILIESDGAITPSEVETAQQLRALTKSGQ